MKRSNYIAILLVSLAILGLMVAFIYFVNVKRAITPESWIGNYTYQVIVENDGGKQEVKKRVNVTLQENKLYFKLYESISLGAYLYNQIGDISIAVSTDNTIDIDLENANKRTIYVVGKLNRISQEMYMEFVLDEDQIKWRYCDNDNRDGIKDEPYNILKKY